MRTAYFALAALCATGCVSSNETYTASGQKGHVISCTPALATGIVGAIANASTSWGTCYQKAGEICGARGYTVVAKSDEAHFSSVAGAYADRTGGSAGFSAATSNNRMMMIQCKGTATAQVQ